MAESDSSAAVTPAPVAATDDELPLTTARIVQFARTESERVARSRAHLADFARRGEVIGAELPACYFALCRDLQVAVRRFNDSLSEESQGLRLQYRETPGVTLREVVPGADLLASVWRREVRFDLILRFLSRANRPDLPIIEGHGMYPKKDSDRVLMRIEGWVEQGRLTHWVSLNFRRRQTPLAEVPERIILSVVKEDPDLLHCDLNPPLPPAPDDYED
jgi:hypothetical protein